uniref:Apple domain-containing protein n=1 Tax=Anabas testudineus TaxID=64144 RepID=A0A3Q1H8P6_ANATE
MGTHFILLGLLYLCGVGFSQDCKPQLLHNWDFPGSDIISLYSPDVEHCQYLCTQHSSCLFFTFIGPDSTIDNRLFYCFLKSTPSGQPINQGPKPGTTAGFSLRPCNPDPKPCLSKVYWNTDFTGADYRAHFTPNYEECQRVCTNDPGCQFFTFANDIYGSENIRYKCHLKFSWTIPVIPKIDVVNDIVSGFSQRYQTPQYLKPECKSKLFPNINYPGNDVTSLLAVSPEQCQTLCSAHPLCTYFSYTSNDFRCYLKNNPNEMVPRAASGVTSGLPARFCQPDNNWVKKIYEDINFPSNDIRYFTAEDVHGCQRACTADPNCQYFSYHNENCTSKYRMWRRCFLKRVITLPVPPRVSKAINLVSGFSLKNCHYK